MLCSSDADGRSDHWNSLERDYLARFERTWMSRWVDKPFWRQSQFLRRKSRCLRTKRTLCCSVVSEKIILADFANSRGYGCDLHNENGCCGGLIGDKGSTVKESKKSGFGGWLTDLWSRFGSIHYIPPLFGRTAFMELILGDHAGFGNSDIWTEGAKKKEQKRRLLRSDVQAHNEHLKNS